MIVKRGGTFVKSRDGGDSYEEVVANMFKKYGHAKAIRGKKEIEVIIVEIGAYERMRELAMMMRAWGA